ncbi:PREDICTED: S-alkyl-thiohydroximate lyase SUR1-like [Tarenaya hassleriana]|uniref:S-alkyl-thiohydroximate lyase SUR1-like n=1 Tax=Tarenaya hassleriana TaxID=28532 RepID=UPI00053C3126|nr:PREDICTED: S-alkyl-thiohydroximate lyase SUR1-like [Tarenaya hassleriana]
MSQHTNLFVPSFRTDEEANPKTQTQMENANGSGSVWRFRGGDGAKKAATVTLRGVIYMLFDNCSKDLGKTILPLGHGDPSVYPCFRTSIEAEDAVVEALRSGKANSYGPGAGILPARRAVADYVNRDIPIKVTPDDIFLTVGCNQGIEIVIEALARPNANILLPRPSFPHYDARAVYSGLEVRKFDLLPEKDWEVDLEGVEAVADENTVAIVIINPNNPCGNVYTHDHLKKVAETARKLGIMVISDEVYDQTIYGDNPFVPMGKFSSIAPVITLGAISKGWVVPGWRIGWMAMNDPEGVFKTTGVVQSIKQHLDITPDPSTMLQVALPQILENTKKEFFAKKSAILKQNVDLVCDGLKDIPCIVCPKKPESCTYLLTKLDLSMLEGIKDDTDFCVKLAREENLVFLPGEALGLKNWLRITIGVEAPMLEEALERLKGFCSRHAKKPETEASLQALKLTENGVN